MSQMTIFSKLIQKTFTFLNIIGVLMKMSSDGRKIRKEVRISDYVVDVPAIILNEKLRTSYERLVLLGSVSIINLLLLIHVFSS